jgi:hypothetical protein
VWIRTWLKSRPKRGSKKARELASSSRPGPLSAARTLAGASPAGASAPAAAFGCSARPPSSSCVQPLQVRLTCTGAALSGSWPLAIRITWSATQSASCSSG